MKRLFLLAVLVTATATSVGCTAARRLEWFPTSYVSIVNNCKGSYLVVTGPYGEQVKLSYAGILRFPVRSYTHLTGIQSASYSTNKMIVVRGWGRDGVYLGSASQSFYPGFQGRGPDYTWEINTLRGGERNCE